MNGLARFFSLGAADADRRVAAALEPRPLDAADRYLKASALVRGIDRATWWMHDAWLSSMADSRLWSAVARLLRMPSGARYRMLAAFLLTATVVHVTITWLQGPRPGWFWLIIPAMTALFAVLVWAGSRSPRSAA